MQCLTASPLRDLQTCLEMCKPARASAGCRHQPLLCHCETSRVIPSQHIVNSLKPCLSQGRGVTHTGSVTRTVYLKYCQMSPKGNLCPKIVTQFPWLGLCPRQIHSAAPHDFPRCLRDRHPCPRLTQACAAFLSVRVHMSTCSTPPTLPWAAFHFLTWILSLRTSSEGCQIVKF